MKAGSAVSELRMALWENKSAWRQAVLMSWVIGLLGFTPTVYMLQVYERVVNSRDVMTLLMLTVVTLGAYAVMELIEKFRSRLLWGAGIEFELRMAERVYNAMFDGLLKKQMGGALSVQNDFKSVRDFFNNPALGAIFELPIALVSMVLVFSIHPLLGWAAVAGAVFGLLERGEELGYFNSGQDLKHSQDSYLFHATPLLLNVKDMLAPQAYLRITSVGLNDPMGYVISVVLIAVSLLTKPHSKPGDGVA